MKKTFLSGVALASFVSAFGPATSVLAQTVAGEEVKDVVTVTAQKREENLQSVPISVKVIDDETLNTTLADGLEDISRLVPSMSTANLSRGASQVQIRGLGSNVGNVGTVAVYNDGVISSGRTQSSGTFAEADSILFDVEAVEVLRGPQGTLWGEGSFGGVISVRSKRPDTEEFQAGVSGTWSAIEGGASDNYNVAGMVNVPIVKDVFAIRAVGYQYDRGGYIDGVDLLPVFYSLPPEVFGEDINTQRFTGGRVIASLTPSDGVDITAIYKKEESKIGIDNTISPNLVDAFTDLDPYSTQAAFSSDYGTTRDVDEAILEINIATPIGTITSVTGYSSLEAENTAPAIFKSEAWSEEARISSDFSGPFNYTAGFYYRDAQRDIVYAGLDFLSEEISQWSIFGQGYFALTPTLTATAGLRYEEQSVSTNDLFYTQTVTEGEFDSIIPKFALDWQASEDTLIYVSAAKGFRAGGANTDQSLGTDANYIPAFSPDEIWNYELGLKTSFFNGIVTTNAALFYIDWSDIQIDKAIQSVIIPPIQFIVVNGEEAHSFGLEADVFISPDDYTDIILGGSILEAEFDGGTIDTAAYLDFPLDGQRLASTPKYVANASIERRFPMGEYEPFIRGEFSARGSSYGDVPNVPQPGGNLASGETILANFRAGVRAEAFEVQFFVKNAFNEKGSTFTFYDGGYSDVMALTQPRTIGINLKLRYN